MIKNVGNVDRAIRLLLSLALFSFFFWADGGVRWVGLIGFVPLLTGLAGTCPVYSLFGASTCRVSEPST